MDEIKHTLFSQFLAQFSFRKCSHLVESYTLGHGIQKLCHSLLTLVELLTKSLHSVLVDDGLFALSLGLRLSHVVLQDLCLDHGCVLLKAVDNSPK